jgi:hypothetical protein
MGVDEEWISVAEIRSALADPDHKSDTPQRFQRHFWPPADEPARDALAAIIRPYLEYEREDGRDIAAGIADKAIEAGWVNLFRVRHDITNTLGMFMVHEDGDPDLGYDRGIVDAMDVVNGTLWTGPRKREAAATDIHACAKCGHAARQHPFPHCDWWIGEEVRTTEAEKIITEGWMREESQRGDIKALMLANDVNKEEIARLTSRVDELTAKLRHARAELDGEWEKPGWNK